AGASTPPTSPRWRPARRSAGSSGPRSTASSRGSRNGLERQAGGLPALHPVDHVGRAVEAKLLEPRRGEAGRVALAADQDDVRVTRQRVQPPEDDRERVVDGPGDEAALLALLVFRARVDEQRSLVQRVERLPGLQPAQPAARL